jgi:large subunit ribosomal protein L25
VTLPQGVEPTITDRDFTIATIAAPTVASAETQVDEGDAAATEEDEDDTSADE